MNNYDGTAVGYPGGDVRPAGFYIQPVALARSFT